jgi:hypothetical protein
MIYPHRSLRGRITLFGEALGAVADEATFSVPTAQSLHAVAGAADGPSVGSHLGDLGLIAEDQVIGIGGDLPIGYGLASSTVMTLLQMRSAGYTDAGARDAVQAVDAMTTAGWTPSGADYAAIVGQESGVFGRGTWTPVPYRLPAGSHLLLPTRERRRTKVAASQTLRALHDQLLPLVRILLAGLRSHSILDTGVMLRYCRILLDAPVYSRAQRDLISGLLDRGIAAKASGAMYDRAVLVLADQAIWAGNPPYPLLGQDEPPSTLHQ